MNSIAEEVFEKLAGNPSRSSAAALGQHFVHNGAPLRLQFRGVDALCGMTCDWSVAILEIIVEDPSRDARLRRYALLRLCQMLDDAIERGYRGVSRFERMELAEEVRKAFRDPFKTGEELDSRELLDLGSYLLEAAEQGFFPPLADF